MKIIELATKRKIPDTKEPERSYRLSSKLSERIPPKLSESGRQALKHSMQARESQLYKASYKYMG